jgi:DNA-binding NarL/FixJ family response regulator
VYAERALRAGARGYVSKHEVADALLEAIRRVRGDEIYVSQKITARLLRKVANDGPGLTSTPIERLSDRELRVFRSIGRGLGTREISEKLHVSVKTVESYKEHIKEKLSLGTGTDLLQYAIQWMRSHH